MVSNALNSIQTSSVWRYLLWPYVHSPLKPINPWSTLVILRLLLQLPNLSFFWKIPQLPQSTTAPQKESVSLDSYYKSVKILKSIQSPILHHPLTNPPKNKKNTTKPLETCFCGPRSTGRCSRCGGTPWRCGGGRCSLLNGDEAPSKQLIFSLECQGWYELLLSEIRVIELKTEEATLKGVIMKLIRSWRETRISITYMATWKHNQHWLLWHVQNTKGIVVSCRITAAILLDPVQLCNSCYMKILLTTTINQPNIISIHQGFINLTIYSIAAPIQGARNLTDFIFHIFKAPNCADLTT